MELIREKIRTCRIKEYMIKEKAREKVRLGYEIQVNNLVCVK